MNEFVRIGNKVYNLSNIKSIQVDKDRTTVTFIDGNYEYVEKPGDRDALHTAVKAIDDRNRVNTHGGENA